VNQLNFITSLKAWFPAEIELSREPAFGSGSVTKLAKNFTAFLCSSLAAELSE
jgi:hypothetical protein